jgi:hypothetical protein
VEGGIGCGQRERERTVARCCDPDRSWAAADVSQGGFGTCYEVTEVSTDNVLAIKIAPKKHLDASKSKRRHLQDEIQIHSSLSVRIATRTRWGSGAVRTDLGPRAAFRSIRM